MTKNGYQTTKNDEKDSIGIIDVDNEYYHTKYRIDLCDRCGISLEPTFSDG